MLYTFAIIAAVASFLLNWFIRSWAIKKNVGMQAPRERDLHQKPIPRLGGVSIVIVFLVMMILAAAILPKSATDFGFPFAILGVSIDKRLLGILLATVLLSSVMLFDDLKGVKPVYKLISQIAAALVLIVSGVGITYLNNPFGLAIQLDTIKISLNIAGITYHFILWADLLLILWVVLLTNATNFIDGLDGLATSLAGIAGLILVFLGLRMGQNAAALLSAVFVGVIVGFFPLNKPPAKMFLGDTGSMFLGLMLAGLTVISGGKFATILLVFGLVIIDAIYVILKRLFRGQNPLTTPDQNHLHHRFLQAGISPRMALVIISLISLAFGLAGLVSSGKIKIELIGVLVIFSFILFAFLDLKRKRART
ncbi:MAG: MraY family glycosyltransferase [Candidatus Berkelbacteria bacterium]|nr:MraY family glycosyltransferase [Candidatus Berkelbacteria bacterium]